MKVYEPTLPLLTIAEIEAQDFLSYQIIIEVVREASFILYNKSPATNNLGLEKCMEAILDLLNTGYAKIICIPDPYGNEEEDLICVGYFNSATGKYKVIGSKHKCKEDDEYKDWQ